MKQNIHPTIAQALMPFMPAPKPQGYSFRGFTIPLPMLHDLCAYIDYGESVGSFLTAVLENDLQKAVSYADEENLRNLPAYVGYLHNVADSRCYGSPEKVREWFFAKAIEQMEGETA